VSFLSAVTTAALWLVAAIGMAAGAGYWDGALVVTLGAILTLGPHRGIAFRILTRFRPALDRPLVQILAGGAPIVHAIERQRAVSSRST
jgi:hypothetical protein